ncbi:macrophage mannose receptor 1-like [Cololabis saira]|uniref:macrophage mannose receptor 1-like n=1 Tax=Cololabis saira TaxID=129043 RepID=UPI002AD46FF5|nr:macrophage mannose receptor 1-like [Cololabis saira]
MKNSEEQNQLWNTLSSAGSSSDVWIGLRHEVDWKWSDGFNGTGADYRDWLSGYPRFHSCREFCVFMYKSSSSSSSWGDSNCQQSVSFLCYRGSQQNPEYVFVNQPMTWSSAQSYCRENFIDLAIMRNDAENQAALREIPDAYAVWMGLYRDPTFNWSDGSSFLSENCEPATNPLNSMRVICGVTSSPRSGKWKFLSCETRLPFVCYSYDTPVVKKTVVKVKVKVDGSVDLKDPAVQEQLLKQLQDKLKEDGVDGVTLKWKKQKDGEVFHKEDEL